MDKKSCTGYLCEYWIIVKFYIFCDSSQNLENCVKHILRLNRIPILSGTNIIILLHSSAKTIYKYSLFPPVGTHNSQNALLPLEVSILKCRIFSSLGAPYIFFPLVPFSIMVNGKRALCLLNWKISFHLSFSP